MKSKTRTILSSVLIFSFFFTIGHATSPPVLSTPSNPETICSYTPFPSFCISMKPPNGIHPKCTTIQDYCRYFLHQSLSITNDFHSLVNSYLRHRQHSLCKSTVSALQDCQELAISTQDYLSKTIQSIGSTTTLQSSQAEYIQTLLSATITDYQTCLDGLQESPSSDHVLSAFSAPLNKGSMSCSVSLSLFVHGWRGNYRKPKGSRSSLGKFNSKEVLGWGRKLLQQIDENNVKVNRMVTVDPSGGSGDGAFKTIRDAVAAAPLNAAAEDGYFMIYVVAGVYKEYIYIYSNKTYIMLVGDGIGQTIITGNRNKVDGWQTFGSGTFIVKGQGFVAMNTTFRNTAGPEKQQAVALRSSAESSAFYRCSFEGYQDTLYAHSLKQFYKQCDIYGTVDFICGNAQVVLQSCNIYCRLPLHGQYNTITAHHRLHDDQNTGISIHGCTITKAPDLAASSDTVKTYLGRPWGELATTVFMQSTLGELIHPDGWSPWQPGQVEFSKLYYGEYENSGRGSDTSRRVKWPGYHVMGKNDAAYFTVGNFLLGDDWLPQTGVTYTRGLM